jgi:predicted RNA methylase
LDVAGACLLALHFNTKAERMVVSRPQQQGQLFRDLMNSYHQYGVLGGLAYFCDLARIKRSERIEKFDARFATDTATAVYPWTLPSLAGHQGSAAIHPYQATPVWLIREILESIPLHPNAFTFIDMGSGKGRTLLVASEFPFAKIIGVELSSELHQIAKKNIERYRPASQLCKNLHPHCMDAIDYIFGPEPLVLFLFNPFGIETVRKVFANLNASLVEAPRGAFVVYVNPRFESVLRNINSLRRMTQGGAWWRPWCSYVIYTASTEAC